MNKSDDNIFGIILAAGAGSRMKMPKAMLKFQSGKTLLESQIELFKKCSINNVAIVVQPEFPVESLDQTMSAALLVNGNWKEGQFSSIMVGISFAISKKAEGIIILPIDTVGVLPETVKAIVNAAAKHGHASTVVPEVEGVGGHPVFLSRKFCERIWLAARVQRDLRLDKIISEDKSVIKLSVNDKAIITNVNTPEEWTEISRNFSN